MKHLRIVICLLCVSMLAMAVSVSAADTAPKSQTASGNVMNTGLRFENDTPDQTGPGYTWSLENKTLTLSGVIVNSGKDHGIVLPRGSTMIVEAGTTNTIDSQQGGITYLLDGTKDEMSRIMGTGTLSIKASEHGISEDIGDPGDEYANDLKIEDVTLNMSGKYSGIASASTSTKNAKINIDSGGILADIANVVDESYGIKIDGGTVNLRGGLTCVNWYAQKANVIISNASVHIKEGRLSTDSAVSITNSSVIVNGSSVAAISSDYGEGFKDLTIENSNVKAIGKDLGIYVEEVYISKNSKVYAEGKNAAIACKKLNISGRNTTLEGKSSSSALRLEGVPTNSVQLSDKLGITRGGTLSYSKKRYYDGNEYKTRYFYTVTADKAVKLKQKDRNSYMITNGSKHFVLGKKSAPAQAVLTKLTAGQRIIRAVWNKGTDPVYQVQFAPNARFTGSKSVTATDVNNVKITKLNRKTKYWVKVRSINYFNGKQYYGAWSSVKTIKTN